MKLRINENETSNTTLKQYLLQEFQVVIDTFEANSNLLSKQKYQKYKSMISDYINYIDDVCYVMKDCSPDVYSVRFGRCNKLSAMQNWDKSLLGQQQFTAIQFNKYRLSKYPYIGVTKEEKICVYNPSEENNESSIKFVGYLDFLNKQDALNFVKSYDTKSSVRKVSERACLYNGTLYNYFSPGHFYHTSDESCINSFYKNIVSLNKSYLCDVKYEPLNTVVEQKSTKSIFKDVIKPLCKKYNLNYDKFDAGDDYCNTNYVLSSNSLNNVWLSIIDYKKGPRNHPYLYAIEYAGDIEGVENESINDILLLSDFSDRNSQISELYNIMDKFLNQVY